jgi:hypothetical protein
MRNGGTFLVLIRLSRSCWTLLSARAEAGHSYVTEGAEFFRRSILVSVSRVGQSHPMARDRVVQVDNPQPRTCKS